MKSLILLVIVFYTAINCEEPSNTPSALSDFCLNGGTLISIIGEYICICPDYFYGLRCEAKYSNEMYNSTPKTPKSITGRLIGRAVAVKKHRWLKNWKQYLIENKECICSCRPNNNKKNKQLTFYICCFFLLYFFSIISCEY